MRNSKFSTHPILVMFTVVAFLFLATGCERTVTMYDKDGKPYTVKEFDPWMTIGGILLTCIVISVIAYSLEPDDSSFLYKERPLFAYAKTQDVMSDALPGMITGGKWIRLVDSHDNLISEHLIQLNKLQLSTPLVNMSEVQLSAEVDEQALKNLIRNIAKANKLNSIPSSIKADVSLLSGESDVVRINAISVSQPEADLGSRASGLILVSEHGLYRVTTIPDKEPGQFSITVSQLN